MNIQLLIQLLNFLETKILTIDFFCTDKASTNKTAPTKKKNNSLPWNQLHLILIALHAPRQQIQQRLRDVLLQQRQRQVRTVRAHHRQHPQHRDERGRADDGRRHHQQLLQVREQLGAGDLLQTRRLRLEAVDETRERETHALDALLVLLRETVREQWQRFGDVLELVGGEIETAVGRDGQGVALRVYGEEVEVHEAGGDSSLKDNKCVCVWLWDIRKKKIWDHRRLIFNLKMQELEIIKIFNWLETRYKEWKISSLKW